jgi:hypothetical protein
VERVFAPIRSTLTELIGFTGKRHRHPVLGDAWAYQVAYWKLYDAVAELLPIPASSANETLEKQGRDIVAEPCLAKPAGMAPAA